VPHSDHQNRRSGRAIWLLVAAAVLGSADWAMTWLLIVETAEGTREVGGLSEGNLRAFQNPGTLLILLAVAYVWASGSTYLTLRGRAW
jgi:hypothetical protein